VGVCRFVMIPEYTGLLEILKNSHKTYVILLSWGSVTQPRFLPYKLHGLQPLVCSIVNMNLDPHVAHRHTIL
jgi:hypothetical protein